MPAKKQPKKGKSSPKGKKDGGVLRKPRGKKPSKAKAAPKAKPEAPAPEKKISVTLVNLGAGNSPVELLEGATVADFLAETGLSRKDGTVLVNNQEAKSDDVIPDGATVVFATNVKGGCL